MNDIEVADGLTQLVSDRAYLLSREVNKLAAERGLISPGQIVIIAEVKHRIVETASHNDGNPNAEVPLARFPFGTRTRKGLQSCFGRRLLDVTFRELADADPKWVDSVKNVGDVSLAEMHAAILQFGLSPTKKGWPPPALPKGRVPTFIATTDHLSLEDWGLLASVVWDDSRMPQVIARFKGNGNVPLTLDELPSGLACDEANNAFRHHKLPFRLRLPFHRRQWSGTGRHHLIKGEVR